MEKKGWVILGFFFVLFSLPKDAASSPAIVTGIIGQSLQFPGDAGFDVHVANVPATFTIECWFLPNSTALSPILTRMKKTDTPNNAFFDFALFLNNGLNILMGTGKISDPYLLLPESRPVELNEWSHLALSISHVVKSPTVSKVTVTVMLNGDPFEYIDVDGQLRQEDPTSPFRIGVMKNQDPEEHYFTGYIDEIRIWSKLVPNPQLQQNRFSTLSGNEPSLVLYYNFDNTDDANLLHDLSPSHLDVALPPKLKKVWNNPPFPVTVRAPFRAKFFEVKLPANSIYGPHALKYHLRSIPSIGKYYYSPTEECRILPANFTDEKNSTQTFPLPTNMVWFTSPYVTIPEKQAMLNFTYYALAPLFHPDAEFAGSISQNAEVSIIITNEDREMCEMCHRCGLFSPGF